jgi:SpoVK/Ycf46/Vps4 family AAA+-type ATPase
MTVSDQPDRTGVTMATGDTLRQLLSAHARRDDAAFRTAALALVHEERESNHRLLADDLERLALTPPNPRAGSLQPRATRRNDQLPRDRERGLPLLSIEQPDVAWQRLVLPAIDQSRLERLVEEHRQAGLLRRAALSPTQRALFVGPPGTGKTLTARVLASALGYPLYLVRFDAIVSSLLGETASNLAKVFDFLGNERAVILFDEFDAVAKERSDASEHGELKRVVTALLQLLDTYTGQSLLIAASNHEGLLDSAVWRRFEFVMRFSPPALQDRILIMRRLLGGMAVDDNAVQSVARKMRGATGSDLEAVATYAARSAVLLREHTVSSHMLNEALARHVGRYDATAPGD